jgi:hypothetical protein
MKVSWPSNSVWLLPALFFTLAILVLLLIRWSFPVQSYAMDCTPESQLILLEQLRRHHGYGQMAIFLLFALLAWSQYHSQTYFRGAPGTVVGLRKWLRPIVPLVLALVAFAVVEGFGMRALDACLKEAMNPENVAISSEVGRLGTYVGGRLFPGDLLGATVADDAIAALLGFLTGTIITWSGARAGTASHNVRGGK